MESYDISLSIQYFDNIGAYLPVPIRAWLLCGWLVWQVYLRCINIDVFDMGDKNNKARFILLHFVIRYTYSMFNTCYLGISSNDKRVCSVLGNEQMWLRYYYNQ